MKQFISGFDLANTVRMAHRQRRVVFVLLEGESDLKTLRSFLLREQVDTLICHGRVKALEAVSELDRTNEPGFLAIVDADFDHLAAKSPPSPNCLFSDHHDLEIDLLCSPAFERLLDERASPEKRSSFEKQLGMSVLDALLDRATPLGHLRLINSERGHSLRFTELNHARFLNRDDLRLDLARLVGALVQRSETSVSATQLRSELDEAEAANHEPRLLCCGHDVIAILAVGLRAALGSWPAVEASPIALERELRLAFTPTCFAQTGLFARVRSWEQANPGWPVLTPVHASA